MTADPLTPRAAELVVAIIVELAVGDPQSPWHPVAVFGQLANQALRRAPKEDASTQLVWGTGLVAACVGGVSVGSALLLGYLRTHHRWLGTAVAGCLLKASFSYVQLEREALRIADLLDADRLPEAREALRALVSRPSGELSAPQVASAAIESVAENLSDSVIAPLLAYAAFGVPGALAYRASNTLDAMVGYHGPYEYLGKAAARLDDLANLLPARLTAVLLCIATLGSQGDANRARSLAVRDHAATESPNAGWPMAAMAGALGVELEKPGHYRLGSPGTLCTAADIRAAVQLARRSVLLGVVFATLATWARWPRRSW